MPFKETSPMNERLKFVCACLEHKEPFTHLCDRFGISRKNGYKWLNRYYSEGLDGLKERSRAHNQHPHKTSNQSIQLLLDIKKRYPNWGPRKIRDYLTIEFPQQHCPSASTIGDILKQNGLVKKRTRRSKTPPYTAPFMACTHENKVWSIDYKGQFKLGNGLWCYPLTITDNYSRYLLECEAQTAIRGKSVKDCLERVFREHGLPEAMRSDNGSPFASHAVGGLSKLSIWWLKLGILPERIRPGCPQQNGRHERMHRTLKQHCPPEKNFKEQQSKFNDFMDEYNHHRPHEGIGSRRPGELYRRSARSYPNKVPRVEYSEDMLKKKVRPNGCIRHCGDEIYIGGVLSGEWIGMTQVEEGQWEVCFAKLFLGLMDTRKRKLVRPSLHDKMCHP